MQPKIIGVALKTRLKGVKKKMGATKSYKIGDIRFYRTMRLGNLAWKVYFKVGDQKWKATIASRRFFVVTEPNPTGVRVTISPLTQKYPKFVKDYTKAGYPTEKGEALLLVALTFDDFDDMGVLG
jgi:hypothetical protein